MKYESYAMKSVIALASGLAAVSVVLDVPPMPAALPSVRRALSAESIPQTLDECFVVLAKMLPADTLQQMRAAPEGEMARYHHGLGTGLRNDWGLWAHSPLYEHLQKLGLHNPDDMSGLILTSFWRYLHDRPLGVQEQVQKYRRYARAARIPDRGSNSQCPSGIEIVLSLYRVREDGSPRMIHMGKCCPDARVWSYELDRSWHPPDEEEASAWSHGSGERCDPCRIPACPS